MPPVLCRIGATWPERNSGFAFRDFIKSKHAGVAIIVYYTSNHSASGDRDTWEQRIRNGQVAVNGVTETNQERVLRTGDVLTYTRLPWSEPPAPSYVDLLYEDEHMVALSKPPGLQVLPAAMFHDRTVLGLLQRHYGAPAVDSSSNTTGTTPTGTTTKDVAGVQGGSGDVGHGCTCQGAGAETGASRGRMQEQQKQKEAAAQRRRQQQQQQQLDVPVPVHRLGRGTSGLLLCARTPEARRRLTDLLVAKTAIAAAAVTAASTPAGTGGAAAATAVPAARATGVGIRAAASAPGGTYQEGPAHGAQPPGEHTENANGSGAALALVSCRGPATDIGSSGAQAPAAATSGAGGGMGGAGGGCVLPLRKIYRALVQGLVAEDQGRVEVPIGPIPHPGVDGGLFAASPDGKPAASSWRVLERRPGNPQAGTQGERGRAGTEAEAGAATCGAGGGKAGAGAGAGAGPSLAAGGVVVGLGRGPGVCMAGDGVEGGGTTCGSDGGEGEGEADETLLEVEIFTGRPHQIRIHTAAMGHPLVGDPLYGVGGVPKAGLDVAAALAAEDGAPVPAGAAAARAKGAEREGAYAGRPGDCGYHLHAHELHLPHPATGQPMVLRAPPPPRLKTQQEQHEEQQQQQQQQQGGEHW